MKQDSSRDIEHRRGPVEIWLPRDNWVLSRGADYRLRQIRADGACSRSLRLPGRPRYPVTPYGRRVVRSRRVSRLGPTQPADDCRLDSSGDPALVCSVALPKLPALRDCHGGLRLASGVLSPFTLRGPLRWRECPVPTQRSSGSSSSLPASRNSRTKTASIASCDRSRI